MKTSLVESVPTCKQQNREICNYTKIFLEFVFVFFVKDKFLFLLTEYRG